MKTAILNQKGEKSKDLTLSALFDKEISPKALTLYVNYLQASKRFPVANTKDRSQVSGGGKKPWKQKGTGNARAGSSRSPLWVGGGVTFGPSSSQNFKKRINDKEKKRVILGIFGKAFANNAVIVVSDINLDAPKTKQAAEILSNLKAEGKISIITTENRNSFLSFRNLPGVKVMLPNTLDMIYVLTSDKIVITEDAYSKLIAIYSVAKSKTKEDKPAKEEKEVKEEIKVKEEIMAEKAVEKAPKAKKTVSAVKKEKKVINE